MRRRMMTWGGLGLGILVLLFFTGKALPAQEAPIPVGILEPFTGPAGWVGPNIMEGAKVALEEINQAGGPLGRPIRLISADTEGRTDAALAALSKLADVDQVVAILGPTSLTAVPVTRKVEEEVHVPIVDPTGGTSEIDNIGGVWAFQVQLSDTLMGPVMAKYALDQGWKKGVLLFGNTGSAISVERNLKVAYPAAGGTIVGDFIIEEDQPSYRAELQRILTAKPDVIFFEVGPKTAATLFREWFQMAPSSLRIQWFGTDFVNQSFIRQVGPDLAEGVLSLSRGPAESERYEAWKQKYYQINKTRVVKALSEYAYDALNIVALAIEAAGHVSREGIAANIRRISNPPGVKVTSFPEGAAALRAGKEIDYDGLTSPADFTDFGLVIGPYTVSQVQKGNLVRLKTLMPKVKLVETFATLPE